MRFFSIIVLAALFAAPAASQDAKRPELTFSPWTKICLGETCFIGGGARTVCGLVVAAVLIEKTGETMRTLRVTLPIRANLENGVRIGIDQAQPVTRPYLGCLSNGCMADYETGEDLVTRLKQGQMLVVDGIDSANAPIHLELPLAGFAETHDGPSTEPIMLEELPKEYREAQKRVEEARRRAQCGWNRDRALRVLHRRFLRPDAKAR